MRRWILCAAMAVSAVLFAEQPQQFEALSANISLENETGYFILSDGSFWKAIPYIQRWRDPLEWWNDVRLVPKEYETQPKKWAIGSEITVYSRGGLMHICDENASNQEAIRQCTHLLMNMHTGQVLFAIPYDPARGLEEFYHDVYNEAYEKGHAWGYSNGNSKGYSEGYRAACKKFLKE